MLKLRTAPGISNAELARVSDVTPQFTNTVLHRLQKLGLVSRPETALHGRSLPIRLTQHGTELVARAETAVRAVEDRILGTLTPAERQLFERMLTACIEHQDQLHTATSPTSR